MIIVIVFGDHQICTQTRIKESSHSVTQHKGLTAALLILSTYLLLVSFFSQALIQVSMETACVTSKWRQNGGTTDIRWPSYSSRKVATKEHWVPDTEQAKAKCLYDMNSLKDQTSTGTPPPAIYATKNIPATCFPIGGFASYKTVTPLTALKHSAAAKH